MDVSLATPAAIETFVLIAIRASTLLLAAPMFNMRFIPPQLKLGLSLLLAALLLPLAPAGATTMPFSRFLLAVGQEVLVGLLLAFAVTLVFAGTQFAAGMLGLQFGFSLGAVIDPTASTQETVIGQFYAVLTGLIFFVINGHHLVLTGLARSIELAPPRTLALLDPAAGSLVPGLLQLSGGFFGAALRIALPIMGALLLADIAMAVMSRSAPQMNVYFVALPVKILLGVVALLLALPLTVTAIEHLMGGIARDMLLIIGKA